MIIGWPKFKPGEAHVHACPECYEDAICGLPCSWHLDPDRAEGPPKRGSHAVCNRCDRQATGKKTADPGAA